MVMDDGMDTHPDFILNARVQAQHIAHSLQELEGRVFEANVGPGQNGGLQRPWCRNRIRTLRRHFRGVDRPIGSHCAHPGHGAGCPSLSE